MNRLSPSHHGNKILKCCRFLFLPLLLFVFTDASQAQCNLTATWIFSNTSGDTVHFYAVDTSSSARWYWSFGDGTLGSGVDPVHVYAASGTYQVCLHIYQGSTCGDTLCSTITVGTPCPTNAAWQYYVTGGDSAHFYASNTDTAVHLYWNYGDGTSGSGTDPWHHYAQPGTYRVCLYAYLPGTNCSDSFCNYVTIGTGCHITSVWTYTTSGDTVRFLGTDTVSAAHHIWNFGDGTYATATSVTHEYASPGTYHVCFYVYLPNSTCSDSMCNTIVVNGNCNVDAGWTSYGIGDSIHFINADTNTSVHLYWNFGDGSTSSTGLSPWHHYTQAGTYRVCLYAYIPGGNCTDSFCNTVTVDSGCHVNATWSYTSHGDTAYLVAPDSGSGHPYWTFGDGTGTSAFSVRHIFPGPGTYDVCLYVYLPGTTCTDSSCNNIVITSGCTLNDAWTSYNVGDSVHFYAYDTSSAVHLIWNFGDGSSYGSGQDPWHHYTQAGTYRVCLYAYIPGTTCSDSFCSVVTVAGGCTVNATWTFSTHGDTSYFVAPDSSSGHPYWSFGDGTGGSGFSYTHVYSGPGTYHVCLYVYIPGTTCTDSSCNNITIADTCNLNAAWTSYTIGDSAHFYASSTANSQYMTWNFGDGSTGSGYAPWHRYAQPGTYHVCLYIRIPNTTCSDSFCNTVIIGSGCNLNSAWTYTIRGDSVYFTGADTNAAAHHIWVFGDGNYTTGYGATHAYPGPGTYYVCFYVYLPNSTCADSTCNTIVIDSACAINATWTSYTIRDSVHFLAADTNTTVHTYWNFGDGSTGSGLDPWHSYAQPGTYHVCLYAYIPNTNCVDSFCNNVVIGAGCTITSEWTYTVNHDSVQFTGADTNSAAHHIWVFGDGTYSTGLGVSHTYSSPGTYHVCYYVYVPNTDCADSTCNTIVIDSGCTANAAWSAYASGDTVFFFAADTASGLHLIWNAGDSTYMTGRTPFHVYANSATYRVCLYAYYPGASCTDSFCNIVAIGPDTVNASWTYVVNGDTVRFYGDFNIPGTNHYWSYGDGTYSTDYDSSHVYAAPGTYNVCYYVYVPNSNTYDSTCNTITISGDCNMATAWDYVEMAGDTFRFTATVQDSLTYVIWAFGDGTSESGSTTVVHSFPAPGIYHVCVSAYIPGSPCSDTICVDVNTALGIKNIGSSDVAITLSPNPFSQMAVLDIDGPAAAYEVRIYDMFGQLVRTIKSSGNSVLINRGSLTPGIYMYAVSANGTVIGKGKMSVE